MAKLNRGQKKLSFSQLNQVYNHVYSVKQIILLANIQHSEEMVSNCVNRDQIILDNKDQCNFLIGGNAVFFNVPLFNFQTYSQFYDQHAV